MKETMLKIISGIRRRLVEPKVYAVLFKNVHTDTKYLSLAAAYSLEEAVGVCRKSIKKNHAAVADHSHLLIEMWVLAGIDTLFEEHFETRLEKDDAPNEKNQIMATIIAKKDAALLEKHKADFSEPEYQFLSDRIKSSSKT